MNKAGKIAYLWLKAQSDSEKIRFIAQALGSVEYQAFIKKYQPEKQHAHNLPLSFFEMAFASETSGLLSGQGDRPEKCTGDGWR